MPPKGKNCGNPKQDEQVFMTQLVALQSARLRGAALSWMGVI